MNPKYICFFIILLFCCGYLFPGANDPQLWWQAELRIIVSGEYAYMATDSGTGYNGNYSFTAFVLGSLDDDDGDDFIFVQAYEKIAGMKWKEVIYNEKERKELNLQGKIEPGAILNYVFGRDGELSFDFEIEPVSVPYKNSLLMNSQKNLHLPESAGDNSVADKTHYNNGLVSGSNRVVLAVKDMYSATPIERVYKWKWQKNDPGSSWNHSHQVEARLKIIPLKKQAN